MLTASSEIEASDAQVVDTFKTLCTYIVEERVIKILVSIIIIADLLKCFAPIH